MNKERYDLRQLILRVINKKNTNISIEMVSTYGSEK